MKIWVAKSRNNRVPVEFSDLIASSELRQFERVAIHALNT